MKGWYGNREKHSLASRGISTREISYFVEYPEVIDYDEVEEIIVGFWFGSLKNNYSKFDFDKAFKRLNKRLEELVSEWGYLGVEMWKKHVEYDVIVDNLCEMNDNDFCKKYDEMIFSDSSEKEMDKFVFENSHDMMATSYVYDIMAELYEDTSNPPNDLQGKIILMDRLVHATHDRGSIWYGDEGYGFIDIDMLRDKTEKVWEQHKTI